MGSCLRYKKPSGCQLDTRNSANVLNFINSFGIDKTAQIRDLGGGDSRLVDFLILEGFQNITVLDISEKALERAKIRLGEKARKVTWIVSDITEFKPQTTYDIWHDRATFHFLTSELQIKKYMEIASSAVTGFLTIGTFSDKGPKKCSGLDIKSIMKIHWKRCLQTDLKNYAALPKIISHHLRPCKILYIAVLKELSNWKRSKIYRSFIPFRNKSTNPFYR